MVTIHLTFNSSNVNSHLIAKNAARAATKSLRKPFETIKLVLVHFAVSQHAWLANNLVLFFDVQNRDPSGLDKT